MTSPTITSAGNHIPQDRGKRLVGVIIFRKFRWSGIFRAAGDVADVCAISGTRRSGHNAAKKERGQNGR